MRSVNIDISSGPSTLKPSGLFANSRLRRRDSSNSWRSLSGDFTTLPHETIQAERRAFARVQGLAWRYPQILGKIVALPCALHSHMYDTYVGEWVAALFVNEALRNLSL